MDKEYVKNNYLFPNCKVSNVKNPTGFEYSYSPFGDNHGDTFLRNYENTKLRPADNNSRKIIGNVFDSKSITIDPRPSILIGYDYRN